MIGLVIVMVIVGYLFRMKVMLKILFVLVFFNINEFLIFGFLVIFNFLLLILIVVVLIVLVLIVFLLMKIGFMLMFINI